MPRLGLCVTTTRSADCLFGLVEAAGRAGLSTQVFFTGDGVALLADERFPKLLQKAEAVAVCEVSARQRGIEPGSVAGLRDRDFATQARNAELVDSSDRYLVL